MRSGLGYLLTHLLDTTYLLVYLLLATQYAVVREFLLTRYDYYCVLSNSRTTALDEQGYEGHVGLEYKPSTQGTAQSFAGWGAAHGIA